MAFIRKTSISLNIFFSLCQLELEVQKLGLNGILIRFIFLLIQTPPLYILIEKVFNCMYLFSMNKSGNSLG